MKDILWIDWSAQDKQLHAGIEFVGAFILGMIINPLFAALVGVTVGVIKEQRDKRHPESHTADPDDAAASMWGAYAGAGLAALVHCYLCPR